MKFLVLILALSPLPLVAGVEWDAMHYRLSPVCEAQAEDAELQQGLEDSMRKHGHALRSRTYLQLAIYAECMRMSYDSIADDAVYNTWIQENAHDRSHE